MSRFASRWAEGDRAKIRTALLMLLCLRGTPVLYQGDEIGLGDPAVAHEDMRTRWAWPTGPAYAGRDAMRTPMPWRPGPGGGFTEPGTPAVAPPGRHRRRQRRRPTVRSRFHPRPGPDLIALRRRHARTCRPAPTRPWPRPPGCGPGAGVTARLVALNLSEDAADSAVLDGRRPATSWLATDQRRDGESVVRPCG